MKSDFDKIKETFKNYFECIFVFKFKKEQLLY